MSFSKRKKPKFSCYDRFWDRVEKRHPEACWEWVGLKTERGYGRFWINGALRRAHTVSYGWLVGSIPEGMELDHLCRNPSCVNPSHLQTILSSAFHEQSSPPTPPPAGGR